MNLDKWIFFFRNCTNEEMETKLAALTLHKAEKVVKGNFVGQAKRKVKSKNCENDTDETFQNMIKIWGLKSDLSSSKIEHPQMH